MAYYPDVLPGSKFVPSAQLSNDVRHLMNTMNGFRGKSPCGGTPNVIRVQVYNASNATLGAGCPVSFTSGDDQTVASYNVIPCVSYDSNSILGWGVLTALIVPGAIGDCIISGPVWVRCYGHGDFVQPSGNGFVYAESGMHVMYKASNFAYVNIGVPATGYMQYTGPFALSYNYSDGHIVIAAGSVIIGMTALAVEQTSLAILYESTYIVLEVTYNATSSTYTATLKTTTAAYTNGSLTKEYHYLGYVMGTTVTQYQYGQILAGVGRAV